MSSKDLEQAEPSDRYYSNELIEREAGSAVNLHARPEWMPGVNTNDFKNVGPQHCGVNMRLEFDTLPGPHNLRPADAK